MYKSLAQAIADAEAQGTTLARVALAAESRDQGRPVEEIRHALGRALAVMRGAVDRGMTGDLHSASGLVGGDAALERHTEPVQPAGPLGARLELDAGALESPAGGGHGGGERRARRSRLRVRGPR